MKGLSVGWRLSLLFFRHKKLSCLQKRRGWTSVKTLISSISPLSLPTFERSLSSVLSHLSQPMRLESV